MVTHGAYSTDTRWYAAGLTTYWLRTVAYNRTCWYRMHDSTWITTLLRDISRGNQQGSMRATLEASAASSLDHHETRAMCTACSQNSAGQYRNHYGGNASVSRGYFQKPGAL